jgi:hypothetical protein
MMRFLPPRAEFHTPLGVSLFSLFGTAVLAAVSVLLTAFAVYLVVTKQWGVATFVVAATACFVSALTGYVGRDLHGKWGLRVLLDYDGVKLDLPSGRSLIHRPPEQHLKVPYADIAAVETRLEAYRTLGMAIMQRAYVLRRKTNELIFLFEDRALATSFESHVFPKLAADIAARAHVPLRDLGMVEGRGGVFAVWGTHAPDWAVPSLPLALQLRLWRHAAITGSLAFTVVVLAITIRALFENCPTPP